MFFRRRWHWPDPGRGYALFLVRRLGEATQPHAAGARDHLAPLPDAFHRRGDPGRPAGRGLAEAKQPEQQALRGVASLGSAGFLLPGVGGMGLDEATAISFVARP